MTRSYIKRTQRNESWCLMIKEKRQIKSGMKRFWLGLSNWEGGRTGFCDGENFERSVSGHVKFWVLELFKRRYLEGSCICEPSLGDRSALKTTDLGTFRTPTALKAADWMRLPLLFFLLQHLRIYSDTNKKTGKKVLVTVNTTSHGFNYHSNTHHQIFIPCRSPPIVNDPSMATDRAWLRKLDDPLSIQNRTMLNYIVATELGFFLISIFFRLYQI